MYNKYLFFTFIIIAVTAISCKSKEKQEIDERNNYLHQNNITTQPTASGLYYIETLKGNGKQPKQGSNVTVHYTGKFLNGKIFDSSVQRGKPFSFKLGTGQVIKGWDEGIALMTQGGKATLIIPSELAYGNRDYSSIPAYSTLIFDVELLSVK